MIPTGRAINKMNNLEAESLYGGSSQIVRLEWITKTGGTPNPAYGVNEGATPTTNVLDNVAAIWGPVQRDQKEKTTISEETLSIDQQGFWYFANDLNLTGKPDLLILNRKMDKAYSGDGTSAAAIWTPDTAPAWTVNEWTGYWLVFPTSRFKILSNTVSALTVDLDGETLPVGSNTGEILTFVKWKPTRDDLSTPGGSLSPLGQEGIYQSILCNRLGIIGV